MILWLHKMYFTIPGGVCGWEGQIKKLLFWKTILIFVSRTNRWWTCTIIWYMTRRVILYLSIQELESFLLHFWFLLLKKKNHFIHIRQSIITSNAPFVNSYTEARDSFYYTILLLLQGIMGLQLFVLVYHSFSYLTFPFIQYIFN